MTSVDNKYWSTYSGKKLLKIHTIEEKGIWMVNGEDPNCDLGGNHHKPYLGLFTGSLSDAVEWATKQPKFWAWGHGGTISKQELISND